MIATTRSTKSSEIYSKRTKINPENGLRADLL
jgi:hypothetical protein